jgi:hypothetical protein
MYTLYYGDDSYDALAQLLQQQGATLQSALNEQRKMYLD